MHTHSKCSHARTPGRQAAGADLSAAREHANNFARTRGGQRNLVFRRRRLSLGLCLLFQLGLDLQILGQPVGTSTGHRTAQRVPKMVV